MPLSSGLAWEEVGHGAPMVLLPGFGSTAADLRALAARLGKRFRVLTFDLPGHGLSAGAEADGTLPAFAAAVHRAVRRAGLDDYHLVGISLGGAVAVRIALDHPREVRALVGVVPWNAEGTTADDEVIAGFAAAYGDRPSLEHGVATISEDRSRTAGLARSMLSVTEQAWRGWLTGGALTSQAAELPRLRVPTCYVIGGRDAVVDPSRQLEDIRRIPGGRAVVLSDLGHLCVLEAPEVVATEVLQFLDDPLRYEQPSTTQHEERGEN